MPDEDTDARIIRPVTQPVAPELWNPIVSSEANDLLQSKQLDQATRSAVREEARYILANCLPPEQDQHARRTGLAVGYVQSGKTLSFTTVAALAADNAYPIVILITGVSTTLNRQSQERVLSDLRIGVRSDHRWIHLPTPTVDKSAEIQAFLDVWADPDAAPFERQRTLVITAMKQYVHLEKLCDLMENLNLRGATCIIIDDEADQASLNTLAERGRESTTYSQLLRLRQALPRHTFLQYTATPQAPLLINIIDMLSPEFVQVLTPGPEYIGGHQVFFGDTNIVRDIPDDDLPTDENQLDDPPDSFLEALRLFFIGVSAGIITSSMRGQRSMLIHPSHLTASHETYHSWVLSVLSTWRQLLAAPPTDPDREDLITQFAAAHADLNRTVSDLVPFGTIIARLHRDIASTRVQLMNATPGKTPEVDWNQAYSWILVGGQALERGFTINGLTVTYMPRGVGVGTADTIQQRGRFFGYKQAYLGYCRVFLTSPVQQAFMEYVRHEEAMRKVLVKHQRTGRPLGELKRLFFLDSSLRPTRRQVMASEIRRHKFGGRWEHARRPHLAADAVLHNRNVIATFVAAHTTHWQEDSGHPQRSDIATHNVARFRLDTLYQELLCELQMSDPDDSELHTMLLFLLREHIDNDPNVECLVYVMSKGRVRERSTEPETQRIINIFQGAHPDKHGAIYPGDNKVRADDVLTFQLHHLDIDAGDRGFVRDVWLPAAFVPPHMAEDVFLQDQ